MSLMGPGTLDLTIAIYFSLASPKRRSISVVGPGLKLNGKPAKCGLCHKILQGL